MTVALPANYRWLASEGAPRMLVEAVRLFGTLEGKGDADNPTILAWASETGLGKIYNRDAIPWCGLFMAVVAQRAGKLLPKDPLWALNWSTFGEDAGQPSLGDVLTFTRPTGGHVALYVGEDNTAYHVLGGNQGDAVSITRIDKKRLYRARSPIYAISQPANVRPIILSAIGKLSQNEA